MRLKKFKLAIIFFTGARKIQNIHQMYNGLVLFKYGRGTRTDT